MDSQISSAQLQKLVLSIIPKMYPDINTNPTAANPTLPNTNQNHFLTELALTACGFEQATRSTTPRQIWNIHPHGGTAMRDALLYGNDLMIKLHQLLEKQATAANWSFLHILITDGHDTDSRYSYDYTYRALSTLRADLNVRDLKVIILGVDIEYGYAQQLRNLVGAAGIHGEYHDITHTDLNQIFHRIRTNFGLPTVINNNLAAINEMKQIQAQMQYYAVLFTLDISGSMHGHKWDVTRHAVIDFIRYLGPNDIVSAIVFNDYPHLVMHWNTRQNQQRLGIATENRPFEQLMTQQGYYDPEQFGGATTGIRQPLNRNVQYVVRDPYNDDDCCCSVM